MITIPLRKFIFLPLLAVALMSCGEEEDDRVLTITQAQRAEIDAHNGRVIIGFHDRPHAGDRRDFERNGGHVRRQFRRVRAMAADIPAARRERVLNALERNPRVRFVEPDYVLKRGATPNDTHFGLLWGLHNTGQDGGTADVDIDAPEAWDLTTGDPDQVIAVIDTGVQIDHVDLVGNIWVNPDEIPGNNIDDDGNGYIDDINGWDFANDDASVYDGPDDDHGTHVSGTIAARSDNGTGVTGINWSAKIMALKFLDGPDGTGFTSDAVSAVEYAADKGVKLTSNSWGGGGFSQSLYEAIQDSNSLFVAAAGNDLEDTDVAPHYPSSYDLPNIISVASIDRNNALPTGWGTDGLGGSNFGAVTVDLAAPGSLIASTYPGDQYVYFSGTSMATPHVAGVAGLVWALDDTLTVNEVRDLILENAVPNPALDGITTTGGVLNAFDTLSAVGDGGGSSLRFAMLGDFGDNSTASANVAAMVAGQSPDVIVTAGDDRYGNITYQQAIGDHYGAFLPGGDSPDNRFFPAPGNHDYSDGGGINEYLAYFDLPGPGTTSTNTSGSELYYDVIVGPVHFFLIDSDEAIRNSTNRAAQQAWLQTQMSASTSAWQVVLVHHAPYSSSSNHGSNGTMQWDFAGWGADAVLAGHDHIYERISRNGILYFVNGLGGRSLYGIGTPVPGSEITYNGDYGAMIVDADEDEMTFRFLTRSGAVIDTHTLTHAPNEGVVDAQISGSSDDAEERASDGGVDLTSTDIELGDDPGHNEDQTVGLRFQGIAVPQGATITAAYLEFETDEADTAATDVTIQAQDADTAATFTATTNDITNRPTTAASVNWSIPAWNTVDEHHQSPDLAAVVQEVVSRPGWSSGSSLAFIIQGTGSRTAESYDGESANAPRLHIEFDEPTPLVVDAQISQASDDAEERASNGGIDLNSSDIELGDDPGHNEDQTVGLRFQNITVPVGATITAAYLEFETDEVDTAATDVTVRAQDADTAATFSSTTNDITNRPTTAASVNWSIPAWNTVDERHQSPDLSAVVQEVVSRPGWAPGASLAFIINGTGSRTAESYNGEPANAARLHIEYSLGGCTVDADCSDDLFCNGTETCNAGVCENGAAVVCDDGVGCTTDNCDEDNDTCAAAPDDNACDNGLFCDGAETCDAVLDCQAGTPVACDDGVGCTVDTCNEGTDSCDNAPDDNICDNGLFCDGTETCDAQLDCQTGTPVACDDGVGCTTDSCNEGTDSCDNAPDDSVCDNGLFCDGAETCDAQLDCQAGTPVACDDGVGCTVDTCDEGSDSCGSVANDSLCDNGLFCDGAETCDAQLDCQAGTPVACDDGVGCTTDSCNEGTDSCDNAPDDSVCDNGLFCDGAETCDAQLDCQAGEAVACDDGVGCTTDSCNEGTDSCDSAPDDSVCDNGLFCDGAETCDAQLDCQTGAPVVCEDGVGCTTDSCDEGADSCAHVTDDSACDNGLFCDGAETCDAQLDCQAGAPVVCDDGVGCTTDTCDEGSDSCGSVPDDGACDNGLFCDGSETCDAELDCQAGTPVVCDDGVGCTTDACDEGTDSCGSTPDDSACDNGLFCDGAETCDAELDCQAGTAPDCSGAGDQCNDGVCDEDADACAPEPLEAGTACDDDDACTESDVCDGDGLCAGSGACDFPLVYFSLTSGWALPGGGNAADEDIIIFDPNDGSFTRFLDMSDVGVTVDLDAFFVMDDGSVLMSFQAPKVIGDLGTVDDSDIVRFIPTSTGNATAGTFEWYFDGSDVALTRNGEDIDALTVLDDGTIVFSTVGNMNAGGVAAKDEDLVAFTPTSLGENTAGTFALYFDGSDVGLATNGDEDVWACHVDGEGDIFLAFRGDVDFSGATGADEDVFQFVPASLGGNTSGAAAIYVDGTEEGIVAAEDIDAIWLSE